MKPETADQLRDAIRELNASARKCFQKSQALYHKAAGMITDQEDTNEIKSTTTRALDLLKRAIDEAEEANRHQRALMAILMRRFNQQEI